MKRLIFLWLLPLCLCAAAPEGEDDYTAAMAGRVVDEAGAPVVGASVSTTWSARRQGNPLPLAQEGLVTDENGLFSGELFAWRFPSTITAYSADGSLAAMAQVEEDGAETIELVLRPTVRVSATVTSEELGETPDGAFVSLSIDSHDIVSLDLPDGTFDLLLPQGELSWMVYDTWFSMANGEQTLSADSPVVELGVIDLPVAFLAKHVGRTLPEWTVSASRGVPLDGSGLEAHRGKWLLIEFWGYW